MASTFLTVICRVSGRLFALAVANSFGTNAILI
jgi:hypothetical protein